MTSRELKQLEEFANRSRHESKEKLCEEHAALAKRTVDQLDESIHHSEQTLRSLGILVEDFTLPQAVVGAMGLAVTELRRQLPALREAIKEVGSGDV